MSRVLRVWKLKTLINTLHLLDLEAPGGPASNEVKGPGGSAETNQTPQGRRFYVSGRLWEAKGVVFYVSGSSKKC